MFGSLGNFGQLGVTGASTLAIAWSLQRLVIEGDSITSITPSTYSSTQYGYRYDDLRPDLFVEVRAQASRTVGWSPTNALDDNSNSLIGNVAEDETYSPDLITYKIGANDMAAARTTAQHRADLIALYTARKAANSRTRIAWSPPLPWRTPGATHASYTNFMTQRAGLIADCRNPAVWGQWADYFIPMGMHPDFLETSLQNTLFGAPPEDVHPVAAGHDRLLAVFKEAVNTIADSTRANSTVPYEAAWPTSENNLAIGTEIVRRFIVSGIAPAGLASGISVSSSIGAQLRLNGGTYGTSVGNSSGNGYRIYNGDVIDLKLTTSASASTTTSINLTIGSETRTISYTTTAAVTPISLTNAGTKSSGPSSTAINLTNLVFGTGEAVVAITAYTVSGDGLPASLTLTPTGGGSAITLTRRQSGGRAISRAFGVYSGTVTAGTYNLTGTRPAAALATWASYCTLENADPTPVATPAFTAPANESDPHLATSVTVPANGIALGWLMKENTTAGGAGSGSTLVNTGQITDTGSTSGLVCVQRASSGQCSMTSGFGTFGRGAIAWKALGT